MMEGMERKVNSWKGGEGREMVGKGAGRVGRGEEREGGKIGGGAEEDSHFILTLHNPSKISLKNTSTGARATLDMLYSDSQA